MARGRGQTLARVVSAPEGRPAFPTLREARYSQSLERGLGILTCFTPERPVLGISEIAEGLGMTRSTTHRYVVTLLALGYLEQGTTSKYRLGLRVSDIGIAAINALGLREHARGHLQELRRRSGYTVSLALLDGADVLYVERARSHRRGQHLIDMGLHVGSRLPAYCTAMGKLLLAYLPEAQQREAIGEMKLTRRGPRSITSKRALTEELARIREEGLAVNDRELTADLHSIAVPVHSENREVIAAVNIAAHTSTISLSELVALGPHLIATADRISARLGYREPSRRADPPRLKRTGDG